jgi:hypothetical protein
MPSSFNLRPPPPQHRPAPHLYQQKWNGYTNLVQAITRTPAAEPRRSSQFQTEFRPKCEAWGLVGRGLRRQINVMSITYKCGLNATFAIACKTSQNLAWPVQGGTLERSALPGQASAPGN